MINAIQTALSGLAAATQKVEKSANSIANPNNGDRLAEDIVNLKLGENEFKANLITIKAAEEISDELFRIFDKKI